MMRKRTTAAVLLVSMAALILDSRCAAQSAADALELCGRVLVPSLFPLFVVSGMLVPNLKGIHLPFLSRQLGIPDGSEGLFLLGCAGGFPVGAACIAQAVGEGGLSRPDGERMLGLCSFCGPAFLFGVLPQILPLPWVLALFVLQLETGLLLAAFWPGTTRCSLQSSPESVSLPEAVRRAVGSMISVCAWVTLASVAAGFLRRWVFPLLPEGAAMLLTGLLELTGGIFSLPTEDPALTFRLCPVFVCFGGISVLLQVGGLAIPAGLGMKACIAQKTVHALLGAVAAAAYLQFGALSFFLPPAILFLKMALEIPRRMVYNDPRKEGI